MAKGKSVSVRTDIHSSCHAMCRHPKLLSCGLPRGPEVSGRNRSSPKKDLSFCHEGPTNRQGFSREERQQGNPTPKPHKPCGAPAACPQNPHVEP